MITPQERAMCRCGHQRMLHGWEKCWECDCTDFQTTSDFPPIDEEGTE